LILRAAPLFIELKKLFASGIFGGKISVEGKYLYGRWDKLVNGWRGQPDYSVVLGGLIHLVDLLCFITGNYEYESHIEYARLTRKFPYDVNDFSSMILSNEIIGVANLTTNFSTPIDHRRDFSIYGDKSWVEVVGKEISVGGSLVDYNLKNLKASAGTKGDLLRAFIGDIHGDTKTLYQYPTRDEMLDVIEICLG
jgi:predicted dehydrogenase